MDTKDVILEGLDRIRNVLRRTLDGLTLEEIHRQPSADTNSIAWLAWHLTRVQDNGISGLADGIRRGSARSGTPCFTWNLTRTMRVLAIRRRR